MDANSSWSASECLQVLDPVSTATLISGSVHFGFQDVFQTSLTAESLTDEVYAVAFTSILGLSALLLCAARYWSDDPIFPKKILKLPCFQCPDYDSVLTNAENVHEIGPIKTRNTAPEPLEGWRLRMGALQGVILLVLIAVHAAISVSDGPTLLRIMFIVYWVRSIIALMLNNRALHLPTTHFVSFRHFTADLCITPYVSSEFFHYCITSMWIFSRACSWNRKFHSYSLQKPLIGDSSQ